MYDQLLILNDKFEVDPTLLAEQGLPFYSSTWVVQLLATNLVRRAGSISRKHYPYFLQGMAATFTHLLLWNRDDLRGAWSWMTPSALKRSWADFNWKFWQDDGMRGTPSDEDGDIDPHYKEMLKVRTHHDVLNLAYQRATCSIQMLRIAGTTIPCYSLMQRLPCRRKTSIGRCWQSGSRPPAMSASLCRSGRSDFQPKLIHVQQVSSDIGLVNYRRSGHHL